MPARLVSVNVSLSLPSKRPSTMLSSMDSIRAMTQCLLLNQHILRLVKCSV